MGDHSKVHVFWDLESCAVPRDVDPQTIAKTIRQAIAGQQLRGPTSFSAYGDIRNQSSELQEALANTNITVNHIPNGILATREANACALSSPYIM